MRKPTLRERLLSKTRINWETGCWEWTAYKNYAGYGRFNAGSRVENAYRVAYELIEGPIPTGLELDHLCFNRACINPAHLEPVTRQENARRSAKHCGSFNRAKTHCPAGHEYTPENTHIYRTSRRCKECNRAHFARWKARKLNQAGAEQ